MDYHILYAVLIYLLTFFVFVFFILLRNKQEVAAGIEQKAMKSRVLRS